MRLIDLTIPNLEPRAPSLGSENTGVGVPSSAGGGMVYPGRYTGTYTGRYTPTMVHPGVYREVYTHHGTGLHTLRYTHHGTGLHTP